MSDSVTLWTVACQTPPSMEFSKQGYYNGLPCHPPGDLPAPGIEPVSSVSCISGSFFIAESLGEGPVWKPASPNKITGDQET